MSVVLVLRWGICLLHFKRMGVWVMTVGYTLLLGEIFDFYSAWMELF